MTKDGESESLLAYAGVGGAIVCCLGIEVLGGAVVLGSLAATIGLSTWLTYLIVAGASGVFVALLTLGYRRFQGATYA